jgi:hypothetical protein
VKRPEVVQTIPFAPSKWSEIDRPEKKPKGIATKRKALRCNSYWIYGSFRRRVVLKLIRGNDEREAIG